jgi:ABC-2 type transport system ATP-binding protein
MRIEVHNLTRCFGDLRAVDNLSFSFRSGDIFGFVGPNGAGKTTTMRIMATLDDPTEGDVTIDSISAVQQPEKARQLIGFVPDTLPIHSDMTAHEYLDFYARAYGLRGGRRIDVVFEIEQFCNLMGLRNKLMKALSKGMRQRLSVARALVNDPPVLVMDEPAAGLDPHARIELRELVRQLAARGKAVLISSHILSELSEMCTGAVIIEQGRLLRAGLMNELDGESSLLIIRAEQSQTALHKRLLETPGILQAQVVDGTVQARVEETLDTGKLLSGLIAAGFTITEFRRRKTHLEDIFMSVTKGKVQ